VVKLYGMVVELKFLEAEEPFNPFKRGTCLPSEMGTSMVSVVKKTRS